MTTRRLLGTAALGLPLLPLAPLGAAAQGAYPERPVTLVVPWAAGGSTDAVARILAARLSQDTGKSFVIDNRAGANGTIGFASVARARPDGYTLLVGTISTYAMAPHLYQLPYDNDRAFTGVGLIAAGGLALILRGAVEPSVADWLAADASARPAVERAWSIGTSDLVTISIWTMVLGAIVMLGAVTVALLGVVAARRGLGHQGQQAVAEVAVGAQLGQRDLEVGVGRRRSEPQVDACRTISHEGLADR